MEKRIPKVGELYFHGIISEYQPLYIRLSEPSVSKDFFKCYQITGFQLDPTNKIWDTSFESNDLTSFECELVAILYGVENE